MYRTNQRDCAGVARMVESADHLKSESREKLKKAQKGGN